MGLFTNIIEFNESYTIAQRNALSPVGQCLIYCSDTKSVHFYDGAIWIDTKQTYPIGFGFDGVYGHSSTSYQQLKFNAQLPLLSEMGSAFTKLEAMYIMDYETEGASTMDAQLFDYTNLAVIVASEKNFPNQLWGHGASDWHDVTANAGHSVRLQIKRNGGTGTDNVKVESGTLLIKLS